MRKSKENKEASAPVVNDLKVLRAVENQYGIFMDLEINGVTIYGCRFVEGKKGNFVSFPSHKGKDGKYYNYAYIKLDDAMIQLIDEELDKLL